MLSMSSCSSRHRPTACLHSSVSHIIRCNNKLGPGHFLCLVHCITVSGNVRQNHKCYWRPMGNWKVGEKRETDIELWLEYMMESSLLEDLGTDGRIIWNWILQKEWNMKYTTFNKKSTVTKISTVLKGY